jgi:CubicO group peptidase (beta-lactamase class C family)
MAMNLKRQAALRRLAVVAGITLTGCASEPPRPEALAHGDDAAVKQYVEALIAHEMRANNVTGLSIAVVDDQRVVFAQGAGWADREAHVPATERTVYRMGSISKLLTATAALQLAQQGKLALDQPIQNALPGFKIRSRYGDAPITARELMTHHAGLPRDVAKGMWGSKVEPFQTMVAQLADEDAAYPPGLLLAYSNVGVTVLGAAIEQVAGEPFADHMQRTVLEPLSMGSAAFSTHVSTTPAMAKAYRGAELADEPELRDVPAGGLNASVLDMSRFLMMVFADGRAGNHAVLQPAAVAEMLRVQNADVALDVGFKVGLGWMLSTLGSDTLADGGPVAHHAGATIHFRSQMYALPEHKLGVIVASNSSGAGRVVDTIAKHALAVALEAKTGIRQPASARSFRPSRLPWTDDALQAYVGEYATVAGYVKIVREGRQLKAQALGRELELLPGEDGRLSLRYAMLGFITVPLGDLDHLELQRRSVAGRDVLVARIGEQEMLVGERIPTRTEFLREDLVGVYEPVAAVNEYRLLEDVRISESGGILFAEAKLRDFPLRPGKLPLHTLSNHEAIVLGPLADAGEVIRLQTGAGRTDPHFSGYDFKVKRK